jgi:hypothetical protein
MGAVAGSGIRSESKSESRKQKAKILAALARLAQPFLLSAFCFLLFL